MLAIASFASPSILAAPISSSPALLNLTDNSAFFGDTLAPHQPADTFTDRFTFSIADPAPQSIDALVASTGNTAATGLTGLALPALTDMLISSGNMVSTTADSVDGEVMLAPVPEPATYGMMLGGAVLLGFYARRCAIKSGARRSRQRRRDHLQKKAARALPFFPFFFSDPAAAFRCAAS